MEPATRTEAHEWEQLYRAVNALANVDDHARSLDGCGFSKFDTDFGRSLAERRPESWSPRMAHAAWRMLRRYRRQLSTYGIDYGSIPEPPDPRKPETPAEYRKPDSAGPRPAATPGSSGRVSFEAGQLAVRFPYSAGLVQKMREIPGRAWDSAAKAWRVALLERSIEKIHSLAREANFEIEDSALVAM